MPRRKSCWATPRPAACSAFSIPRHAALLGPRENPDALPTETSMDEGLARRVRERARHTCEYCLMPQAHYPAPFQNDHIIAEQHGGPTALHNLALSCLHWNEQTPR